MTMYQKLRKDSRMMLGLFTATFAGFIGAEGIISAGDITYSTDVLLQKLYMFAMIFAPFTICAIAYRGLNNRILLFTLAISIAFEWWAFGKFMPYTWEKDMYLLHLVLPGLITLPFPLIILFRLPLTLKLSGLLMRFAPTRQAGFTLAKNTRPTRLDLYLRVTTLCYLAVYAINCVSRAVWFAMIEFTDKDDLVGQFYDAGFVTLWHGSMSVCEVITLIECAMLLYVAYLEYRQPDTLYTTYKRRNIQA